MKFRISGVIGGLDWFVERVGRFAAWLGVALVLLVAFNVLARYLLSAGTVGLQELEWHLLAVCALIGMSYGLNRGEEVRVDLLYEKFSERQKTFVNLFAALLTLAIAVILLILSIPYVEQSLSNSEGSPDPGGLPYRYVLKAFIPLGFFLLALQSIVEIYKNATAFMAPNGQAPIPIRREPPHGN